MAPSLERRRQLCSEAEWRKRLAIGEARGLVVGADRRASGSDVGRSGYGDAQATDRRKPQRFVAVFHPARHHLQKKASGPRRRLRRTSPAREDAGFESKARLTALGVFM